MSRYRDTVLLPKTDFPMRAGLATREPQLLERWSQEDLYAQIQKVRSKAPLYILHDGPPFANWNVHMGTALNKVLKDLVIKSKTMSGFQVPFVPGWDCHGLPIEFKVVKNLSSNSTEAANSGVAPVLVSSSTSCTLRDSVPSTPCSSSDSANLKKGFASTAGLNPLHIREQSEAYARKFIDIQRKDFRRLGIFGDWDHPYLTLDPAYEASVVRSFGKMVDKGLVYQSKKPVLWSTGARTALAEAEIEYHDKVSPAAYVAFPLVAGQQEALQGVNAVIWTTTPWTLPANAAIALQPEANYVILHAKKQDGTLEGKYLVAEALVESFCLACALEQGTHEATFLGRDLEGTIAMHPFLPRSSTLYAADFVTLDTGTGLVHIAPGHGDDDYALGVKKGLPVLSPVDDAGALTEECGVPELVGKNVFVANPLILEMLASRALLLGQHDHHHSYPHCWRSKTPILFRAVEQFFISIAKLRETALEQIDKTEWIPAWGRNRIRGTVENRPDWCVSRQRCWGVPLPAFYDPQGAPILDAGIISKVADVIAEHGSNAWFRFDDARWCELVGAPAGSTRRNDTLDVWIDSGVSHEAVLRARPELQFPADLYLEATDQHRGWFQSSLMTSVALNDVAPYKTVLTHGFVVDVDTRQKISKSNQGAPGYQKPTEADHFIKTYGADIVRLWASSVQFTDEVPFSEEIFARLTDSYRRLRNTFRILLGNLVNYDPTAEVPLPTGADAWILERLQDVVNTSRKAYDELAFQRVYHAINQFCTVDLSSHYVDVTKDRLYCDAASSPRRRSTQATMATIFETLVRLLAPILVFTTEEAWGYYRPGTSIHCELFPESRDTDTALLKRYEKLFALRGQISQALEKAQREGVIANPLEAIVKVSTTDSDILTSVKTPALLAEVEELFILSHLEIIQGPENIIIEKEAAEKCERCWRHREDVGSHKEHPTLCGRCAAVVA